MHIEFVCDECHFAKVLTDGEIQNSIEFDADNGDTLRFCSTECASRGINKHLLKEHTPLPNE